MQKITSSKSSRLPRTSILLGSLLALFAVNAQAENVPPADTYVQQYTGDYPLATTESVTTFNEAETSQYPNATVQPGDVETFKGYEASAQENREPLDAIYTEVIGTEAAPTQANTVNVDAAYTSNVPVFINKSVASNVALDSTAIDDRDAPAGYYTQFGAFGQLDNAARLRAKLTAQLGKPAVIIKDRALYKVQVGPMQSSQEAFGLQKGHPNKLGFIRR